MIAEAFQLGADGVLVMGCHLGECHYQDGNQRAKARLSVIEEMLSLLGLEQERFRLVWCSSAESERFASIVREVTALLKGIGPSPYREDCSLYTSRRRSNACNNGFRYAQRLLGV